MFVREPKTTASACRVPERVPTASRRVRVNLRTLRHEIPGRAEFAANDPREFGIALHSYKVPLARPEADQLES